MKLKGHGSAVAIAVSVLALVVAGGTTAVAVSATIVNIADPTTPSHVAKVDSNGRLAVGVPGATINSAGYLYGYTNASFTQVTSATKATLYVTRITLSNPTANGTATEEQLSLNKYPVDSSGACVTTTAPTLVARYNLAPGDDIEDVITTPLIVKSTGATAFCLYILNTYLGSTSATPSYYLVYGVSAYTIGAYTGIGVGTVASPQQSQSAQIGS